MSSFANLYSIDEYLSGRNELYEKLEMMIQDGASKTEMETTIDCLKMRTGCYGIQRKQLINNLFKGIVDLSFPDFAKYLFSECKNNKGLFAMDLEKEEDPADASKEDGRITGVQDDEDMNDSVEEDVDSQDDSNDHS